MEEYWWRTIIPQKVVASFLLAFQPFPFHYYYSSNIFHILVGMVGSHILNTRTSWKNLCLSLQRRQFDKFIGGGSIAYCSSSPNTDCRLLTPSPKTSLTSPNGLVRGRDGLYYIPSSIRDSILVTFLDISTNTLHVLHTIHLGMPVDNMSVDSNGDIWAAAFPKILDVLFAFRNPREKGFPSTIWRIRRVDSGSVLDISDIVSRSFDDLKYETTKILEERDVDVIRGATVARHDVKTGRLFLGGECSTWNDSHGLFVQHLLTISRGYIWLAYRLWTVP